MRAILYVKQILLTHPHLKKYDFPICAKGTELLWGCVLEWGDRTASGEPWHRAAQAELEKGLESSRRARVYWAVNVCSTSADISKASEPQDWKASYPCHQLYSGPEPLPELLPSALHRNGTNQELPEYF